MESLGDLIASQRTLVPLRQVLGGDSPLRFPVEAYCSRELLSPVEAWSQWIQVRSQLATPKRSVIVITKAAPLLAGGWEKCVKRAERMLQTFNKNHDVVEPTNDELDAYLDRFDVRHVLRQFGVKAEGPEIELDDMGGELFDLLDASDDPVVPFPPIRMTRPMDMTESEVMVLQAYVPRSNQSFREIAWPFMYSRHEGGARVLVVDAPSWQVPGLLGFELNEKQWRERGPYLRRWTHRYGFDLVALTRARLEAHATKPPRSYAQVHRAAKELGVVCPDILDEGPISSLTEVLGHCWRLWWD